MRAAIDAAVTDAPAEWVEELILQTYLFAGFPRALNAAREWRRAQAAVDGAGGAPSPDDGRATAAAVDDWRRRGERTCATVYGTAYSRLRGNITALHPALDEWMIVEGYGKVLSRPGLDLGRRELCIVAACAHTWQARQLHSHLHGALNAGVPPGAVTATFDALDDILGAEQARSARLLWGRVVVQRGAPAAEPGV